jgi:hypothetical protein
MLLAGLDLKGTVLVVGHPTRLGWVFPSVVGEVQDVVGHVERSPGVREKPKDRLAGAPFCSALRGQSAREALAVTVAARVERGDRVPDFGTIVIHPGLVEPGRIGIVTKVELIERSEALEQSGKRFGILDRDRAGVEDRGELPGDLRLATSLDTGSRAGVSELPKALTQDGLCTLGRRRAGVEDVGRIERDLHGKS